VLDVVRLRGSVHEVNQAVLQTARADGNKVPIGIPQDPGSAGKFMVQQFTTLLAGYNLLCSPESGPKIARAAPISAQVEGGNLAVIRAPWTHAFIEELREFPHGRKDDQVDALSRAFVMLTDTGAPSRRLNVPLMAR
jgi:predicted phage terminase large subunit-like protein